jgi:DNA-binding NarL/FixJ family response regulator
MIRAILIEDESIIGAGLRSMFHPSHDGIAINKVFRDVQETLSKTKSSLLDIIILDLWIGKKDPLVNVMDLKNRFPEKPILIFTGEESIEWKRKMIQAGVDGYISKLSTKSEIKKAIRGITANGKYFPSTIQNHNSISRNNPDPLAYSIIVLVSEGFTLKEIAAAKKLSVAIIENILAKLRKDYHVSNNNELVKVLYENNIFG